MRSIGLDLEPWLKKNLLRIHATRPTAYGLEVHLATFHKLIGEFQPHLVVVDPITAFSGAGTSGQTESMLMRLVDFLKGEQITAVFTSLSRNRNLEESQVGISSLIDTWLLLLDLELGGERNRGIYVLKSRGMAHSNQIREFLLTDHGFELKDVYVGAGGGLTGSMRLAQEAREESAALSRHQEIERRRRELQIKRQAMEAQIAAQRSQFEVEAAELNSLIDQKQAASDILRQDEVVMARSRKADQPGARGPLPRKTSLPGGRKCANQASRRP
jgi:circadian clock protein KaiC